MTVKFLKAGSGDSILVEHQGTNILIDGGNESSFLLQQAGIIHQRGELIDLLIITHHDDDHIKGIITLLQETLQQVYGAGFIRRVMFNSPQTVKRTIESTTSSTLLSYKQARQVENLLTLLNISPETCTESTGPYQPGNGLSLHFLSPRTEDIVEYANDPGALLTTDYRCDWAQSLQILETYLNDKSQDRSLFNKSSIILLLECEGKRILLTGDATPDRLNAALDKLMEENEGNIPFFDLVKLPHHGSYRSLNTAILGKINCRQFLISTDSKRYFLPNKRAILKILKYIKRDGAESIKFLFNYPDPNKNLQIKDREFTKYRFSLIPNNENYGYRF
ncbi:MAG: ComEC/Rec2 family competence protein [Sediminibacterium sp.]